MSKNFLAGEILASPRSTSLGGAKCSVTIQIVCSNLENYLTIFEYCVKVMWQLKREVLDGNRLLRKM